MDRLEELRNQIDVTDKEIVALFEKRMALVQGVAEYKKANNTGVLQTSREEQVLQKAVDNLQNKDYADAVKQLMTELMGISKDFQRKKISSSSILKDYKRKPLDIKGSKGYYGDRGANSEKAMIDFFGDDNGENFQTFEEIFKALDEDKIQYGVLPIENSSTGAITEVYDLLRKYDFFIVGEQWVG
ncbi:MAG: chorismate mutase, partial [Clostridia bacterium]|nr:chorismate mutase [Clostridia bacterium]